MLGAFFHLNYKLHGGSGASVSWADFQDLGLDQIDRLLEMLEEQRDEERKSLKNSS